MRNFKFTKVKVSQRIPKYLEIGIEDFENHLLELISNKDLLDSLNINLIQDSSDKVRDKLNENKEGYMINSSGISSDTNEKLSINIKSLKHRGLLYGCYGFLHYLGVRWYFPGERFVLNDDYENFLRKLTSELNICSIPAFKKRGVVIFRENTLFNEWLKYLVRNRMNYIVLHSEEGLQEAEHIYNHFGLFISLEEHLFDNKACPYNPKEFKTAYQKVTRKLEKIPVNPDTTKKELYFWLADTVIRSCSCSQHEGWNAGEVHLDLVNHLLRKLNEKNSSIKFSWLAYMGSFEPIRNPEPHKNAILEIAPMHRCFSHSIIDPNCTLNQKKVLSPIEQLKGHFKPENRQVLGYWLDSSLFGRQEYLIGGWANKKEWGRIPHIPFIMQDDIQYYKKNKFERILTFAVNLGKKYIESYTSPMVHLYPLLCWNPATNITEELQRFNFYYLNLPQTSSFFLKEDKLDPKEMSLKQLRAFYKKWNDFMGYLNHNYSDIKQKLGKNDFKKRMNRLIVEYKKINLLKRRYVFGKLMGHLWQKGLEILNLLLT